MKRFGKIIWLCALLTVICVCTLCSVSTAHTPFTLADNYITTEEDTDYLWPAPGSRHITSFFGKRNIALYGHERQHTGIDINAATGADVLSIASGTVVVSTYDGGWGHYIIINHGDNILSLYAHLNSRSVKRGDTVTRGQLIGEVGNTGISSAPHLHFEMRENGKSFNPFRLTFADQ